MSGELLMRGVFARSFMACLLLTSATESWAGDNWPNFHGPTNNNHSDAKNLPLTWSETENVVWKTPIHDSGWSSPVIWGNQIWLTTATDDGKQSFVLCIDRESGKILRDLKLFDNDSPEDTRKYNSFASPTPVIEEGRVYVHFGSYGTACLDTKTAQVIWSRRDLPCLHWRGPGSSPILFEKLLIVHFDGYDHQYAVALDKTTGKTVWKKDRNVDYGSTDGDIMKAYSTPLVIEAAGRLQLISPTAKATLALDPRTGEEIWRVRYPAHSTAARPIFGHGMIIINTGFSGGELLGVRPDGTGDVTESHVVWHAKKNMPSKPSSLLIGDSIFGVDDNGVATCLDAKTGEYAWTHRIGGNFTASPIFADGRIYLFGEDGKTTVIAPDRKYNELAINPLDDGFRSSPAVAGRALFLRTEKNLYRVEKRP
jgi:outer membrane protein assembly factor BamB